MSPTLLHWHLSISCHSLCLSVILSNTEKTSFISNYSLHCLFQIYRKSWHQNLSFLKSNKANTYSIGICTACTHKWSFIDLAYTAEARCLHSGKRDSNISSVQEVRYLLRRWWATRVRNQLKSIDQIMSIFWKAKESTVLGDDQSNWHTYPETEFEVTGWHPSSIITPSPSPTAYLGTARTRESYRLTCSPQSELPNGKCCWDLFDMHSGSRCVFHFWWFLKKYFVQFCCIDNFLTHLKKFFDYITYKFFII